MREQWCEVFICEEQAAVTLTLADAVLQGHSVLLLDLGVKEECAVLLQEGISAAEEERRAKLLRRSNGRAHNSIEGRIRLPVKECLNTRAQELCETMLCKAITAVEDSHPTLMSRLFHDIFAHSKTCLRNQHLRFAHAEPAVNVYTAGGEFLPHQDRESLTLLFPLSHEDSFTGGGTGFWAPGHCGTSGAHSCRGSSKHITPTIVLRPPPGHALVFCGQVTHAGHPVLWGERGVLVASFSPLADGSATKEEGEGPVHMTAGEPNDLAPLFADVE